MTVLAFPNQIRPYSSADAPPLRNGDGQAARVGSEQGPSGALRSLPTLRGGYPATGALPTSYEAMMVYRLGLGRPWLDMLGHDDQARIAGLIR